MRRRRIIADLLFSLVAALACGAGCARPDWIEQTLVTVDVTGTWQGSSSTSGVNIAYEFTLEQRGSKVDGSVRQGGRWINHPQDSGPVEGTVAGDVFSFRQLSGGNLTGDMTVSGDEMTGVIIAPLGSKTLTLRRVESPARPKP